jgi:hypothetical protein
MKTSVTSSTFSNTEVENYLASFEQRLINNSTLNGSQDGQRKAEITETEYKVKVLEPVHNQVQHSINHIRGLLQPSTKMMDVKEIRNLADEKVNEHQKELDCNQRKCLQLENDRDSLGSDPIRRRNAKILILCASICAAADACLAYSGFRNVYPISMAAISALAVGVAVYISHYFSEWVIKSRTKYWMVLKTFALMTISFLFFLVIGNLRAKSINSTPDLSISHTKIAEQDSGHVSGWLIAIISEILFSTILYFSILFYRSKQEKLQDKEFETKSCEIKKLKKEYIKIKERMDVVKSHALSESQDARGRFGAMLDAIKRCKTIGKSAIHAYKAAYLNYHNGVVPTFFSEPIPSDYDESLHFINPEKQVS